MNSLAWPNMFSPNGSETLLVKDTDQTKFALRSNLNLLLNSYKMSLFGDPYYGTLLNQLLFEQYSTVLVDLICDELCTAIHTYLPQIIISRNDIQIYKEGLVLKIDLYIRYAIDNTSDLFTINLTNNTREE